MSNEQTKLKNEWVPLAEAPFKLRFGWDIADEVEDLEIVMVTGDEFGSDRVFRLADGFFIQCRAKDGTIGATIPIGMISYLGTDAALPTEQLAAMGKIVNSNRTGNAIELGLRLAVREGQLGLQARKSLDSDFTDIPPSAVPELRITNWYKGWGEYSTGERLFDIQARQVKSKGSGRDQAQSRRILNSRDANAFKRVRADNPSQSIPAPESASITPSKGTRIEDPQGSKTENGKRKHPHRPPGRGLQKADYPLVNEMHSLLLEGVVSSPTQAARSLVSRAAGYGTPESKISRLVARHKKRFPHDL
jgi:hypothetical protein